MTVALTLPILLSPFLVAAPLVAGAQRCGCTWSRSARRADAGRIVDNDSDGRRLEHDREAIRTGFGRSPASGSTGERRQKAGDRFAVDIRSLVMHKVAGLGHLEICCPIA